MIRKLLSTALFVMFVVMVYISLGPSVELLFILIPATLTFLWEPAGYIALMILGMFLVYRSVGGFLGLMTLTFAIEYIESIYLSKRKAPAEHYQVLFAGTLLAIPVYYFVYLLSFYVPSVIDTAAAAVFMIVLYIITYTVVKH